MKKDEWSPLRQEPEAPANNATSRLHPAFTSLAPSGSERSAANAGRAMARVQGCGLRRNPPGESRGDCESRDSFTAFVLDQLGGLHNVTSRSMFGGFGIYQGGMFFAIVSKGRLYFKTDAATRPLYQERGMKSFRPNARQTLKNYYEVPTEVIEESDQLTAWAQGAIMSGQIRGTGNDAKG